VSHAEWIMSGLTFVYVLLTAVYVWFSKRTLDNLEEQVGLIKAQDAANKAQSAIAQQGAAAASSIAETLIKAQRPFVMIEARGAVPEFWAVNYGLSPAQIIFANSEPFMGTPRMEELPKMLGYGTGYDKSRVEQINVPWIPPGGEYFLGQIDPAFESYLDQQILAELKTHERVLIAYPGFKYRGLDGTTVYTSTYC
jgi:hypothetical protein